MAPPSVLAALLWLVVPWLAAAGESGTLPSSSSLECQRSCGGLEIPFPFGVGPEHCMMPGFQITCKDTGNGVYKPLLGVTTFVEVLSISLLQGQAKVLHPISHFCSYNAETGRIDDDTDEWSWDLTNTVYTFSDTGNKFTVVGCRTLAYIGNTKNSSAMYQTGCVATCFDGKMALNPCSGMGCCQTAIPKGLQYYNVWFDKRLNISGSCSYAVLMDESNFTTSASIVTSSGFNMSRGGMAPVVLEWAVGDDDCDAARVKPGYACVSSHSSCHNAASGRGYICNCTEGFDGNPYLPDGCQDIDECRHRDKYPCHGVCTNRDGSFTCDCPPGTQGSASIQECRKDPFPPRARIAAGTRIF